MVCGRTVKEADCKLNLEYCDVAPSERAADALIDRTHCNFLQYRVHVIAIYGIVGNPWKTFVSLTWS